jgi:DDE superfamily endonuclease
VFIEWESGQIVCAAIATGKTHDFKLLKRSRLPLRSAQMCLADRGYQGFAKQFEGACLPTKKPRKQQLSRAEKQHNRALAKLRVRVEHVIRRFKIFRIFSQKIPESQKAIWIASELDCWFTQLRTGTRILIHAGGLFMVLGISCE